VFPPQQDDPHRPINNPFPYEVILGTTGLLISRLCTRVQNNRSYFKPQTPYTWGFTLSHFRGLFKDYTQPIIVYKLSSSRRTTFTWWIIHYFKEHNSKHATDSRKWWVSSHYLVGFTPDLLFELFDKVTKFFSLVKFFLNFFFTRSPHPIELKLNNLKTDRVGWHLNLLQR
jgi:hypothetical protein